MRINERIVEEMKKLLKEKDGDKKIVYTITDSCGIIIIPKEQAERFAKELALFLNFQEQDKGLKPIPFTLYSEVENEQN